MRPRGLVKQLFFLAQRCADASGLGFSAPEAQAMRNAAGVVSLPAPQGRTMETRLRRTKRTPARTAPKALATTASPRRPAPPRRKPISAPALGFSCWFMEFWPAVMGATVEHQVGEGVVELTNVTYRVRVTLVNR